MVTTSSAATVEAGRYTGSNHNQNCLNWTIVGDEYDEGLTITPIGPDYTSLCWTARPVACCE